MAAVTHVYSLDYVATMLGETPDLLEAIVWNDDNLTYGAIVSVYTGQDETITALTDDGIEELTNMLADARRSPQDWNRFLEDFVLDQDIIARVKEKGPRL
ncbi:MAG: hypothetical protein ACQETY_13170 [Pseudomonadota bacterium]|uniref:hypothetical protein n=1 Tax=Salibaculum sp. TaxID=2855480 RepID=UPI0028707DC2|nr:hypothetical protein [Salibaculum sp.]MDR9429012.1 hypothetical protein [Salibaculum sp.]